jgi:hypothetical protein
MKVLIWSDLCHLWTVCVANDPGCISVANDPGVVRDVIDTD